METAITALIVIGVFVLSILGLSERSMSTQAAITDASRVMQQRLEERIRTDLTAVGATTSQFGDYVSVTVKNTGATKLADFSKWDVILQYTGVGGAHVDWYAHGGGVGQWMHSVAESFEPDILNPGEEMVIQVRVAFTVDPGTTNLATVATPSGITATAVFTH